VGIQLKCVCGMDYVLETMIAGTNITCKSCGRVLRVPSMMETHAHNELSKQPGYADGLAQTMTTVLAEAIRNYPRPDGRYPIIDDALEPGTVILTRDTDLAAAIADKGAFRRAEDGRRHMVFFEDVGAREFELRRDGGIKLSFSRGIVPTNDDPQNDWTYFKISDDLWLGVANGMATIPKLEESDEITRI
jgi:hypothetical protein